MVNLYNDSMLPQTWTATSPYSGVHCNSVMVTLYQHLSATCTSLHSIFVAQLFKFENLTGTTFLFTNIWELFCFHFALFYFQFILVFKKQTYKSIRKYFLGQKNILTRMTVLPKGLSRLYPSRFIILLHKNVFGNLLESLFL